MEKTINEFLKELKEKYTNVYFKKEFIKDEDSFKISVSNLDVYHSYEFNNFIGEKLFKFKMAGNPLKFYFSYNEELLKDISSKLPKMEEIHKIYSKISKENLEIVKFNSQTWIAPTIKDTNILSTYEPTTTVLIGNELNLECNNRLAA